MPKCTLYDVNSHKVVNDINLDYPVLRSRERAFKFEVEANLFSLFDWPSVIVNLCSSYLVGETNNGNNNTDNNNGLSYGRNTGEADLLRLSTVNRYFYRAVRAHPVWLNSSFSLYSPTTLGRYSRAFYTRDISRYIEGARKAYKLLDLFTFRGCGARRISPSGVTYESLQRAQIELDCIFPPSLVACMMLRHPSTIPWAPQQGAWGDLGDDNELEGSGGMALLPLEVVDSETGKRKFDGWLGDMVALTLAKQRDKSSPIVVFKDGKRVDKKMVAIGVTRNYPTGSMLYVDCSRNGEEEENDEDGKRSGGIYDCRPLSVRRVADNFVEYLFSLTE